MGHLCPDIDRVIWLCANFSLSMQLNQITIRKLQQFIALDRNNEKRPIVKRTLSTHLHTDVSHKVCNVSLMPHYRTPHFTISGISSRAFPIWAAAKGAGRSYCS